MPRLNYKKGLCSNHPDSHLWITEFLNTSTGERSHYCIIPEKKDRQKGYTFNSLRQDNLDTINDEIEKTPGHWRDLKMEVVWIVVERVKATMELFSGNDTDVYLSNLKALKELRNRNEGEREDGHMWKDGKANYLRVSY
jgi:hypothetical protein